MVGASSAQASPDAEATKEKHKGNVKNEENEDVQFDDDDVESLVPRRPTATCLCLIVAPCAYDMHISILAP